MLKNNKKLQSLANEMVDEIKNLKDLTKKELPAIAKEYITYLKVTAVIQLIISGALILLGTECVLQVLYGTFETYHEEKVITFALGGLCLGVPGLIAFFCNLDTLISVALQPKRTAIKAITSLFNGDD